MVWSASPGRGRPRRGGGGGKEERTRHHYYPTRVLRLRRLRFVTRPSSWGPRREVASREARSRFGGRGRWGGASRSSCETKPARWCLTVRRCSPPAGGRGAGREERAAPCMLRGVWQLVVGLYLRDGAEGACAVSWRCRRASGCGWRAARRAPAVFTTCGRGLRRGYFAGWGETVASLA